MFPPGYDCDPAIKRLDLSALDEGDLVNLVLQRSEVLAGLPRPGRIIKAWENDDEGPIRDAVARLGEEIARRAAAVILREYREIAPVLAEIAPRRLADIGCGYAFFDLFALQDMDCDVLLIDLEQNSRKHFGFRQFGAAYSSLATARSLLEANGINSDRIMTLNPAVRAPETETGVDLAVSFLSCGFHYPAEAYMQFFRESVTPSGAVILDLRQAKAAQQGEDLARLGSLHDLPSPPKSRRVLLRKGR
ncbi:hypothetical protein C8N32_12420 [Rhodovulum imhoffii]|uniref:Methyltransferase family protein n=1 Tax=Rhodovulum imhoffii TaxID=365340 RepID=A0A2T5BNY6_9RHOB|nr:class I SAM-dependent methyltransferase [Rhodovulum imhoffii]PTN00726.1 hypothetical protein C8N32_12420 [Rhodovulum imhoffii]